MSKDDDSNASPSAARLPVSVEVPVAEIIRLRTRFEAAAVGLRVAASLARRFELWDELCRHSSASAAPGAAPLPGPRAESDSALLGGLKFAVDFAAAHALTLADTPRWRSDVADLRSARDGHLLNRLFRVHPEAAWGHLLLDLVLLAALPELHEGFAALFRCLHPEASPYPTVALGLDWLEDEASRTAALGDPAGDALPEHAQRFLLRDRVETLLCHSDSAELGMLQLSGDAPWHSRTLRPGAGVWAGLSGRAPRLSGLRLEQGARAVPGLDSWLRQPSVQRAVRALALGVPCVVAVVGGDRAMRTTRVQALLGAAGVRAVAAELDPDLDPELQLESARRAYRVAFCQGAYPWLDWVAEQGQKSSHLRSERLRWEVPLLVSAPVERCVPDVGLPLLSLTISALPAVERRRAWSSLLPGLSDAAAILAARYPVEPAEVRQIAGDLALYQRVDERPLGLDDVAQCLRARSGSYAHAGVTRVVPKADWKRLLVPELTRAQLAEAVLRVHQQIAVLDDWGFAQGRAERRGTRLLFFGPPGTGKTLAAESMAHAIGVDLLVVDIASLVSKWIGETEKNLAAVFELAERARALVLFDEADALFGRRSDAKDANDRHANLETAYLLQRLERFEGVAVLTTNLRTNLDAAFTRRFEFIVEFPEPDATTREALWRLHVPPNAPIASDVNFAELAAWYAISGAQIKNAALAAAFLASAAGVPLGQTQLLQAIAREYDKAGRAHPGFPQGPRPHAAPASTATNLNARFEA